MNVLDTAPAALDTRTDGRTDARTDPSRLPPRLLAAIAIRHAARARFDLVEHPRTGERTWACTYRSETHDVWLIRWGAGARTELHDHGGSAGALFVYEGELVEVRPNPTGVGRMIRRELREFEHRPMSSGHVHEVANESRRTAASIHVYSPPLATMQHYEPLGGSALRTTTREHLAVDRTVDTFAGE